MDPILCFKVLSQFTVLNIAANTFYSEAVMVVKWLVVLAYHFDDQSANPA